MTTPRTFESTGRLFSWASLLEDKAREQMVQAASMPFVWPHAAGMPDMHWGMGCPIGLVYPTVGAIVPACVGVDIGCGMIAARTNLMYDEVTGRDMRRLRESVEELIPMSPGNYNEKIFDSFTQGRVSSLEEKDAEYADRIAPNWRLQLGSLGGGNHFVEFCRDTQDRIWIFLHSGSRGVGNKLAQKHIRIAVEQCKKRWISLPNPDLAYLVEGDKEFWDYITDLRWAQHFAQLNREEMLHRCRLALSQWYGRVIDLTEIIRCHHNYTEEMPPGLKDQFKNRPDARHGSTWLTRKGAIDASLGKKGLLPGSMGAKSYVTIGRGYDLALWSAPHGAGRLYGRRQANSTFSVGQLEEAMTGIEWSRNLADQLRDEIPYAYKPISTVLKDSTSMIAVEEELTQFVNIKGALCRIR
jgi:tRNA-splicing ligase RtcB (3'-phosphate/5'-hydroxy nucleic acid ligase)